MATYLQMGHESWSLLDEPGLRGFSGIVLSPVNDGPSYVQDRLARLRDMRDELEVILDPQLYNPQSARGKLSEWSYWTSEFETVDQSDPRWWKQRGREVVDDAQRLRVESVCSPAMYARVFSDEYYRLTVEVADDTLRYARERGIDTLLTAVISLRDLGNPSRALEIASILTSTDCERIYLTFLSDDIPPREPLRDGSGLATAVHLIRLLGAHLRVHVAFVAHDASIWKAAGAHDVSSGKWFNVRRFSPSRWREEDTTGRQVAYWNEGSLLTLIRDQEVLRLQREHWFEGRTFADNPAAGEAFDILIQSEGQAWLKLSWIQYLRWLCNSETLWRDRGAALGALEASDAAWGRIAALRILFTDRFNDGTHVRMWLNAVREGSVR